MNLSRKTFLRFVAGGGVLPMLTCSALTGNALALDYPTRPVHIIVGFPAGTSSDITARLVAQRLSEQLELFNMMAGVKLTHIPYRSSQFPDLLSGQVQITFNPLPSSLDFIRAGKLRGLALTGATRSDALPNLPPLGDFLPGYEATAWFGIGAPRTTPPAVVEKLNKEINAALADAQFKGRLTDLGGEPMPLSVADFNNFIEAETDKWAKVVKFSGAKSE